MSQYTKSTNFATKDNLTPGDPLKVVRGTEIDTEFNNISTAIATKTDNSAAAITGGAIDGATVGATTPATGAFTTLAASGTTTLAGALVGAATQSAFNTVSTTLNLGGAATALNLGAATGTATINNTTLAAKAITASTTLAVTGTSTLTGAVTATAGVSGPITSSSVSITGGSITGITDLAVADGGTGASTAAGGLNNLLPSQTGNASKYLQTDGTNASWDAVSLSTADITGTLGAANGGTGVSNNAAMTVTGSGNFAYTRTLTGTTNVTFPTTGTLATLAGTETLTNKTLTSPILTTPTLGVATGTSFQGIIGNVTPAAGSFTTLGASSTATLNTLASSGATLTGGTINGMTVGATTPSSGAFTTVTASTAIGTASGGTGLGGATPFTSGGVVYASSTSALATGSALTFDGTTLGATGPEAFRIKNDAGYISVFNTANTQRSGYLQFNATDVSVLATSVNQPLAFFINGTEGMRLTSTGLGIGTSSVSQKLTVNGTSGSFGGIAAVAGFNTGTTGDGVIGVGSSDGRLDFGFQGGLGWIATGGNYGIRFLTNSGERLRIDSAGNLGLGVTPSATSSGVKSFEMQGVGSGLVSFGSVDTVVTAGAFYSSTGWKYSVSSSAVSKYYQTAGKHQWFIAPSGTAGNAISFTQAMTLGSNGQLSVGTTSNVDGALVEAYYTGFNGFASRVTNNAYYLYSGLDSGGTRTFLVLGTGNVQNTNNSYGAISDVKLKENIVDASPKLADLMQVKVRNYNLKSHPTQKQIGVIAQELETVFPAMIDESSDKDAQGNDLGTTTKAVKYSVFVPMLIKAIQEQQAIIESLKARLDAANL